MKRLAAAIALACLALTGGTALAQSVGNYGPVTRLTGTTYTSIAATGTSIASWRNGNNTDDNRSAATPIGFTFYYMGQANTTFNVSTNGFIDFASSGANGGGSSAYGSSNTAISSTIAPSPLIVAPMYDNLTTAGNPGTAASLAASVKYQTTGSPGSRVLTIEWIGLETPTDTSPNLNFQVKLFEATGAIEFDYGTMDAGTAAWTYSCGINGLTMSATPLASELLEQQAANSNSFGNAEHNSLATVPAANSRITFAPVNHTTPAAPVNLVFSAVTQSSLTLTWTDNSTNETFFTVSRSTNGVTFTPVTTVGSVSTPGQGATYSINETGLVPGTTYTYRVVAANEAAAPSAPLAGAQSLPPPNTKVAAGSGNWSSTTPNAPWPGGLVPTAADSVAIPAGFAVTLDQNAAVYALNLGGSLTLDATTARTLGVTTSLVVRPGGTLATAATGTVTTHQITIGGSLLNNGTVDLSTNNNTAGADLVFTGPAYAQIDGTGAVTDIRTITVNKGNSSASALDILESSLTVQGSSGDVAGFLTIVNGTAKFSNSYSLSNRIFAAAAWTIPATGGLWLDNPNVVVTAQAASATNNGFLRVSQGTLNVGTGSGNMMNSGSGAVYEIVGGTVVVSGRFASSSAVAWTQTGGTVTVANAGNGGSNLGSFDLSSPVSFFKMTGGTIVIRQASSATTPVDWRIASEQLDIEGGTLQLGQSNTTTRFNYRIAGALPNLVINNQTNNKTATLFTSSPATRALFNVTIPFGTTFDLNGFPLEMDGATLQNDGTMVGTLPGARLLFAGASAQTYTGNGVLTGPIERLQLDNPAGLSLGVAIPVIVAQRVDLMRGTVTNSAKITIGNGGASSGAVQIGKSFLNTTGGAFDVSPTYNVGSGGYSVFYENEGGARTTGFELPGSRSIANLSLNNPNGVTLAGGALTITSSVSFLNGVLNTSAANLPTIGSGATPPVAGATSWVNGPLGLQINSVGAVSRTFPIGKGGAYRPLALSNVATGGTSKTFVAEAVAGATGGTPVSPLFALDNTRYWTLSNTAGLNTGARIALTWGADDGVTNLANVRVAQSGTVNGSYVTLGGSTTGLPAGGTVTATQDALPGQSFLAVGFIPPTFAWDGGAGTSNWGDAANWNPDQVPSGTDDVGLATAGPITIVANGAFAVKTLALGSNVTLNVTGGTLTVNQTFTQTAGTLGVAGGAFVPTGAVLLQGGACSVTGGAVTSGDGFTIAGGALTLAAPGTVSVTGAFAMSSGSLAEGNATLELKGSFAVSGGTFTAGTGTTRFAGSTAQSIGAGAAFYDLVLRGGGAGQPKNLVAGGAFTVAHDFTVESTAQPGVSAATATTLGVGHDFNYGGVTGGPNLGSLTITLTGNGIVAGSAALAPQSAAPRTPQAPLAISPLEMNLTVGAGSNTTLGDNLAITAGRTLLVQGRLDCVMFGMGGAGTLKVASTGSLATAYDDPSGLGAIIGLPATWANGSTVEYDAAGDQNIDAGTQPDSAAILVSGGGTKSLDGDKTLLATSGAALTKAAVRVAAGTTLDDGGHVLALAGPGPANVIVDGFWQSPSPGTLAFLKGTGGSSLKAVDGTGFGDLVVNFANSADSLRLQTDTSAGLSFRSITLGGGMGSGNAGGTVVLSAGGITNVLVHGTLTRAPANISASGGGFRGTTAKASRVSVDGDVVSTSVATQQPLLFGPGTNRLELAGASPQNLSFAMSTRVVDDGATLRVLNSNGVVLGGSGLVYTIGGTLDLLTGNVEAGLDTVAIPEGAAVTASGGHVNGALRKFVTAGAGVSVPFEIGSGPAATPLSLLFATVSAGGDVTASTVAAEHPDIANSMIQSPRDANRTWSLLNAGVAFDHYDLTLNWDPADLDAPAVTDSFVVRRYDGATWWPAPVGARTATSITATGLPTFSDFVTGNPDSFLVAASATGGSVTPSGIVRVAPGSDAVFTAAADPGYTMLGWVADGVTSAPADTFTFTAVSADHFLAPSFADTVAPVVQLTSPVGGETFTVGQTYDVTWSASDNVAVTAVDLLLSRTGAAGTYVPVANGIANSGSFSWTVSGPATTNAFFEVVAHDPGGHAVADVSDSAFIITGVNAVPDGPVAALSFSPVAPNQVRQRGTFAFGLPAAAHVRLTVLDIQGRAVAELANGMFEAGRHQVRWDAVARERALPGVYFAHLETAGRQFVQRFVIVR